MSRTRSVTVSAPSGSSEAINSVDAVTDPSNAARCYTLLGRNAWAIGDSEPPSTPIDDGERQVLADSVQPVIDAGLADWVATDHEVTAELRCHDAMAVAPAVGSLAEEGHVRCTLGVCRASLGHHDEGIDLVREAMVIAEELANADDLNRAYTCLSSVLVESGRLEEGASLVFDSAAVGEEFWGVRLNGAAANSADALVRLGRHDQADALLAQTANRGVGSCTAQPSLSGATMAIVAVASTTPLVAGDGRGVHDRLWPTCRPAACSTSKLRSWHCWRVDPTALGRSNGRSPSPPAPLTKFTPRCAWPCVASDRFPGRALDQSNDTKRPGYSPRVRAGRRAAPGSARAAVGLRRAKALGTTLTAERSRLYESDPNCGMKRPADGTTPMSPTAACCRWRERRYSSRGARTGRQCLQTAWHAAWNWARSHSRRRSRLLALRGSRSVKWIAPRQSRWRRPRSDPARGRVGQLAAGRTDLRSPTCSSSARDGQRPCRTCCASSAWPTASSRQDQQAHRLG